MHKYYLAIDIGASSGRHVLAHKENGKVHTEEVYRFTNEIVESRGEKVWDVDRLFSEIKAGMKKCKELGKIPYSMGIDTWGCDFVLLNSEGERIGNAVAYRDERTKGMDQVVYQSVSEEALYGRTGIQKQPFNTIYQLMALKEKKPETLKEASTFLMIPDYFHYLLTGVAVTEYTNATTTQLISPTTKEWDMELIKMLGYPKNIFQKIVPAGTELGMIQENVANEVGFCCKVVLPATHDTGSAVLAIPTKEEKALYISSGTWSLLGTEQKEANCTEQSRKRNFTNEGGYQYRFRYLKNIMGLWMIQSIKKEIAENLSFGEICEMAEQCNITSRVDCNDNRYLAPISMVEEIKAECRETGQQIPNSIGEIASVVYNSLAQVYAEAVKEIEEITDNIYNSIHIVGGGANAVYLNRLTAFESGKTVIAGPTEATAIGNLLVQMITGGDFENLKEARVCVLDSFDTYKYE